MKTITVQQLIDELQKLPRLYLVKVEGCDCVGEATGAQVYKPNNPSDMPYVLVTRADGVKS